MSILRMTVGDKEIIMEILWQNRSTLGGVGVTIPIYSVNCVLEQQLKGCLIITHHRKHMHAKYTHLYTPNSIAIIITLILFYHFVLQAHCWPDVFLQDIKILSIYLSHHMHAIMTITSYSTATRS